jgi:hypothetical protein
MISKAKTATAIVVVLIVFAGLLNLAWVQSEKQKSWEYKHLDLNTSEGLRFERTLNDEGAAGWELVAVDRENPGGRVHFFLKRAVK